MSLFKSERRRQAEDAVNRVLELLDDAGETVDRGRRLARVKAKSSVKALRSEGRDAKRVVGKRARKAKRTAVRTGGNVADLLNDNPGATIGGALALAVAVGAGITYWSRR